VDEEEYLDKINSDPKRVIEPKNGEKKEDDGLLNYKGIHFNDKPGSKFICPTTGSHFRVEDLCIKLQFAIDSKAIQDCQIVDNI
jgi:hypothetical protein